jgi:hypothetical protein
MHFVLRSFNYVLTHIEMQQVNMICKTSAFYEESIMFPFYIL